MPQAAQSRFELISRARFVSDKPEEIRTRLKALVDSGEVNLRDISRGTSFSTGVIRASLAGTYNGDVGRVDEALMRFYRTWITRNAIVQTSIVEQIHSIMWLAWLRKEIALIKGRFGRGKTKAASRFAALNDFAIFVELSGVTSPTELLHRIGEALDIEAQLGGSRSDKLQLVVRTLKRKPRLIIIDEADELRPRTLALLRDIHGEGTERCAIVLIATERFTKLLESHELGYLRRRITMKTEVGEIEFSEAKQIANLWPHDLDGRELKEAWSWSLKHFGTASLVNIMMRAYDMMQMRKGREIRSEDLEAAYTYLLD